MPESQTTDDVGTVAASKTTGQRRSRFVLLLIAALLHTVPLVATVAIAILISPVWLVVLPIPLLLAWSVVPSLIEARTDYSSEKNRIQGLLNQLCAEVGWAGEPPPTIPWSGTTGTVLRKGKLTLALGLRFSREISDDEVKALLLHELQHVKDAAYLPYARRVQRIRLSMPLFIGFGIGIFINFQDVGAMAIAVAPWLSWSLTTSFAAATLATLLRLEISADSGAVQDGASPAVLASALQKADQFAGSRKWKLPYLGGTLMYFAVAAGYRPMTPRRLAELANTGAVADTG